MQILTMDAIILHIMMRVVSVIIGL